MIEEVGLAVVIPCGDVECLAVEAMRGGEGGYGVVELLEVMVVGDIPHPEESEMVLVDFVQAVSEVVSDSHLLELSGADYICLHHLPDEEVARPLHPLQLLIPLHPEVDQAHFLSLPLPVEPREVFDSIEAYGSIPKQLADLRADPLHHLSHLLPNLLPVQHQHRNCYVAQTIVALGKLVVGVCFVGLGGN